MTKQPFKTIQLPTGERLDYFRSRGGTCSVAVALTADGDHVSEATSGSTENALAALGERFLRLGFALDDLAKNNLQEPIIEDPWRHHSMWPRLLKCGAYTFAQIDHEDLWIWAIVTQHQHAQDYGDVIRHYGRELDPQYNVEWIREDLRRIARGEKPQERTWP